MGAVYCATQLRLRKRVAVKVMAGPLAAITESVARFHREALITGSLGHPHIVQMLDFSTATTGEPFLVMELLEGEDLEHRLRRESRLPLAEVGVIASQVASALSAAHAKGVIHRDLKPGNIFLMRADGQAPFVKVLDFGISKVRAAKSVLTRTASVMGTPHYMSPEQAQGRTEDIDERTDQWALACVLWECLSGSPPFVGDGGPAVLYQVVHQSPEALRSRVPELPSQVEDVLLRALAKDKNDRFAAVSDFAAAFECAVTGTGAPASLSPPWVGAPRPESAELMGPSPTILPQSAGEPSRRPRSRLVWALAVSVLAIAVILWVRADSGHNAVKASTPIPTAPQRSVVPTPMGGTVPPETASFIQAQTERKPEPPRVEMTPDPGHPQRTAPHRLRSDSKPRPQSRPKQEDQDIWRVD
jgi:eukaryotic-like serine/threonine-protein kinase